MDCHEVSRRLNAYLDGELLSQAGEEVRDHLAACARCAAEFEQMKQLNHALDALQGMVPPAYFPSRLRQLASSRQRKAYNLRSGAATEASETAGTGRRRSAFSRVLVRAAAGLLVAAGLWVGVTMGGALASTDAASSQVEETQPDAIDLQVHALSVLPAGSVAGDYVALVSESE